MDTTSESGGGNPFWLVFFTIVTGLIAILVVCPCSLTTWSREPRIWLTCSMASPQVPGPAQDKAYKLALGWGILGHSGPSGVAAPTPKVRTKVRIFADEEKRDAIVHAFEVSLVLDQGV